MSSIPDGFASDAVDAINDIYGAHAGHRAAHAKGILCAGWFIPTVAAGDVSAATHFAERVRVHVRFSNGSGDPNAPDGARDGRGMAVKFYLPDETTTDIVAVTLPVFFVRTAEDFLEFTRLRRPDPATGQPDLAKLGAWLGEHPEAAAAVTASLAMPLPASYAQLAYNALHTYFLVDAHGNRHATRYHWFPDEGEASLESEEAALARGPDYLQDELRERLAAGPVKFTLEAKLANAEDVIDDPTVEWPDDRRSIDLGLLQIDAEAFDRDVGDDVLVFDPTRVTDGVECSDDPILRARPPVYSESIARRLRAR